MPELRIVTSISMSETAALKAKSVAMISTASVSYFGRIYNGEYSAFYTMNACSDNFLAPVPSSASVL